MPKKTGGQSDIVFKDDITISLVHDWNRFGGARSNYQKLSDVLADALQNTPDFLENGSSEEIYDLEYKDFNQLVNALNEHRNAIVKKVETTEDLPIRFCEKIRARHLDEWIKCTSIMNPNYARMGKLLAELIEEFPDHDTSQDAIMQWTYFDFIKTARMLARHLEAVTSKN